MNNLDILKELNVLNVDDNIQACENIKKTLEYYFKNVFIAHNGEEALEVYNKKECHLLIVDYDMPIMNGYEFLSKIREKDDEISAMIISSYDDKVKLKNAIGLNLLEYLVKPYGLNELKGVLNKFVKSLEKKELLRYYVTETLFYDRLKKTFIDDSKEYKFTSYEIKLIEYLFRYKNQVIKYDDLLYILESTNQKSLINSVYNINKKLNIKLIENVKDMGYWLKR
ncbi:response regulator transcription factor [Halarcobacter ebronensis]|uniref:Histidine kinase n=1 Tax=Halarcobacter ebronensis TaxID=1462615 RepID=A0A4Q1AQ95_9BACT|nr:response regulator [Halarcobacter ebronensis]QKF81767.1 two-component system response regulator [Halarcobacter ebronensis]RXK04557.1 histidine kinase [Halarcobacter ebronensis]